MDNQAADKFRVPTIYPVDLKSHQTASFGLPQTVANSSVYTEYELMRFLNYHLNKKFSDAETGKAYILYTKDLDGDDLFRLLASSEDNLVQTIASVRNIFGNNVDQVLDQGSFWRYLIRISDSQKIGLESSEARIYTSPDHHDSHAVLEHRDQAAIIRVKATTLNQLEDLFHQIQMILI
ncbi:hypothetical protein IT412_02195 [Candidatus Peregrinibacteria bacterium]|nr:hypothetical protein [Candidatus Peregrinibacteria bacterium]